MTDRRLDERFKVEGDPEDALRALMDTGKLPEFSVRLTDAAGGPRVFDWRGNAPDAEAAKEAALDAWAKHYGERPGNAQAETERIG
jgi:hypothetical protein